MTDKKLTVSTDPVDLVEVAVMPDGSMPTPHLVHFEIDPSWLEEQARKRLYKETP